MSYAKPYSGLPYLSNARSLVAVEQVASRAEEKGDAVIVGECRVALTDIAGWRGSIDVWVDQSRSNARQGGVTVAVDGDADFICSRIYSILHSLATRRPDTAAGKRSAALILKHFTDARGNSKAAVMTRVICEEQLPRMRALLADFAAEPDLARQVRVADWVDDLAEIEPRYAAALEATTRVTWGEVIARRNTAYDSLFAIVGLIFARHRHDPATLGYLLAPVDDQVARQAELARRRRAGQATGNEDELTPDEIAELDEMAAMDDVDGDGAPDGPPAEAAGEGEAAAEGEAAGEAAGGEGVGAEAPQPPAGGAAEGDGPVLRPIPRADG